MDQYIGVKVKKWSSTNGNKQKLLVVYASMAPWYSVIVLWFLICVLTFWTLYDLLFRWFQGSKELGLTVLDEDDNETLLMHNITSDDIYRKQEGELTQYHSVFELIHIFFATS
jgi:hypothetical protein